MLIIWIFKKHFMILRWFFWITILKQNKIDLLKTGIKWKFPFSPFFSFNYIENYWELLFSNDKIRSNLLSESCLPLKLDINAFYFSYKTCGYADINKKSRLIKMKYNQSFEIFKKKLQKQQISDKNSYNE